MIEAVEKDVVVGINIFPIKSCHAATVDGSRPLSLDVSPTGFEAYGAPDRGWVIVEDGGIFVTQRGWDEAQSVKNPQDKILSTVQVDISSESLTISERSHGEIVVPTFGQPTQPSRPIKIFDNELWASDEGDEAATFFSDLLGRAVRLLKADGSVPRMLPPEYHRPGASNQVAGADGFPFLMTNNASLEQVREAAGLEPQTITIDRYRGNIEIIGKVGPFAEDSMLKVRLGNVVAFVVKACSRCPIPNIDQETGIRDTLSTKVLRPRMGWLAGVDTSEKPKPYFGQSLNHVYEPGQSISIGSLLTVLEYGEANVVLKS